MLCCYKKWAVQTPHQPLRDRGFQLMDALPVTPSVSQFEISSWVDGRGRVDPCPSYREGVTPAPTINPLFLHKENKKKSERSTYVCLCVPLCVIPHSFDETRCNTYEFRKLQTALEPHNHKCTYIV